MRKTWMGIHPKNFLQATSLTAALLFSPLAPTVYAADARIGFVNIPLIMNKAPQARAARDKLQREFSGRREQIESCSRDIEDIDRTLRSEGRDMGKSRRERLIENIRKLRRTCDRLKEDFEADFSRSRAEVLRELEQQITRIINRIAEEKNFSLIVGPPVIYVDEQMNLTGDVLDALSRER